ncbi:MAG: acyl-CoA thioesterase [Oscillospiraceae bacterium]|nr:acyl-CoA thioesterase [Oscillospiraceae bacterium]
MRLRPYTRRVFYYETDRMGIVHHSNYIRWFEEARVDVIEQAGLPFETVEAQGIMSPVLSAECEYLIPMKFGDVFVIKAYIPKFGTRFDVIYEVYDDNGVLHARGKTSHCFVDEDLRPVRIKHSHPKVYDTYMALADAGEHLYDSE